jgi:hypothetical protein
MIFIVGSSGSHKSTIAHPLSMAILLVYHHSRRLMKRPHARIFARSPTRIRHLNCGRGSGIGFSGGQLQRLSIARALLRNPTVLILGVFSLLIFIPKNRLTKFRRRGNFSPRFNGANSRLRGSQAMAEKHDDGCPNSRPSPPQIGPRDFVYVFKDGGVTKQGFQADLELVAATRRIEKMMESQRETGGFLPVKPVATTSNPNLWGAFQ